VIDELISELEQRKRERETEFWATAGQIARGTTPEAADVERLLAESGKTSDDLRTAAELVQQRIDWAEQLKQTDEVEAEAADISKGIAAAHAKWQAARDEYEVAILPLEARRAELADARRAAAEAKRLLFKTCPYAHLAGELSAVEGELAERSQQAAELKRKADALRPGTWKETPRRVAERAAEALPELTRTIEVLEQRRTALNDAMLQP
jgi:hypothetical protein